MAILLGIYPIFRQTHMLNENIHLTCCFPFFPKRVPNQGPWSTFEVKAMFRTLRLVKIAELIPTYSNQMLCQHPEVETFPCSPAALLQNVHKPCSVSRFRNCIWDDPASSNGLPSPSGAVTTETVEVSSCIIRCVWKWSLTIGFRDTLFSDKHN